MGILLQEVERGEGGLNHGKPDRGAGLAFFARKKGEGSDPATQGS
jgi:hypothetical protein